MIGQKLSLRTRASCWCPTKPRHTLQGKFRCIRFARRVPRLMPPCRPRRHAKLSDTGGEVLGPDYTNLLQRRMQTDQRTDYLRTLPRRPSITRICGIVWDAAYDRSFTFVRAYPTYLGALQKLLFMIVWGSSRNSIEASRVVVDVFFTCCCGRLLLQPSAPI